MLSCCWNISVNVATNTHAVELRTYYARASRPVSATLIAVNIRFHARALSIAQLHCSYEGS